MTDASLNVSLLKTANKRLAWIAQPTHQRLLALLAEGGEGRFVGSAVRDS